MVKSYFCLPFCLVINKSDRISDVYFNTPKVDKHKHNFVNIIALFPHKHLGFTKIRQPADRYYPILSVQCRHLTQFHQHQTTYFPFQTISNLCIIFYSDALGKFVNHLNTIYPILDVNQRTH